MSDNTEQRDFWTDKVGTIWVDQRAAMDEMLSGVLEGTIRRADLQSGQTVLDIGCGAGTSSFHVAKRVGEAGHVTGIDISRTLLGAARSRVSGETNITFLEADAQNHAFEQNTADVILSRFGVMFFEDSIAAFKNMSRALQPNGLICFSAWSAIAQNPFFTLPAQISRQILGPIPRSDPDAPGPFAFRDPVHVEAVLRAANLEPEIDVVQEELIFSGCARALAETMCVIGPAHSALRHHEADEKARAVLTEALVDALSIYCTDDGIAIPSLINYVTARKST